MTSSHWQFLFPQCQPLLPLRVGVYKSEMKQFGDRMKRTSERSFRKHESQLKEMSSSLSSSSRVVMHRLQSSSCDGGDVRHR